MIKTTLQAMTETEQEALILELQINLATHETAEEGLELYYRECLDWYDCIEDYILDDFLNGNWSDGGEAMLKHNINPIDLANYIDTEAEEMPELYSHIDRAYMVSITNTYNQARADED